MIQIVNENVIDTETGEILGKPISEGQQNVIHMIEDNLNIKFKGYTSKDARTFISENIEKSKLSRSKKLANKACRISKFDISINDFGGLGRHLDFLENKYCDLFSDEEMMDNYF